MDNKQKLKSTQKERMAFPQGPNRFLVVSMLIINFFRADQQILEAIKNM
jgi:acetoacetate decarboxylase